MIFVPLVCSFCSSVNYANKHAYTMLQFYNLQVEFEPYSYKYLEWKLQFMSRMV